MDDPTTSLATPTPVKIGALRRWVATSSTFIAILAFVAASAAAAAPPASDVPGAQWDVTSPTAEGMDPTLLNKAEQYAFAPGRNTQGVVVVRHGRIAQEWYAPGRDENSFGASWSMAKSFTSALIGIAIDEGLIPSVDEPMTTYYPEWIGTPKETMTIRNVLHMESGLKWSEDYSLSDILASDVIQMGLSADELTYAKDRPFDVAPGTRWSYSSGDTMLLSGVLSKATGMSAADYAKIKLFDPIGMSPVDWWKDAAGNTLTYCCLDTSSRNYARFGLLYLHDGNWGGTQVVPSAWVRDSLAFTDLSEQRYGYQWWHAVIPGIDEEIFMANGFDGQFMYVIPALDLVVVRNGTYVKSSGPPIADPTLFGHYPPSGIDPNRGTKPPESWNHAAFLGPIIEAIKAGPPEQTPAPTPPPAAVAEPVAATPAYTG